MEKSVTKAIKWLILIFSFIMFFLQAQIAIKNLRNPPIIDSTENHNIAEVDPPMITVCPLNQFNKTKIKEFGYSNLESVLIGHSHKNRQIGWGAQYNMTFEEFIDEMLLVPRDLFVISLKNAKMNPRYEKRFYPKYGWCIDVSNYTITEEIQLSVKLNWDFVTDVESRSVVKVNETFIPWDILELDVFLTDKTLRTRSIVYKESHWGPSIKIHIGDDYDYMVKVEHLSNFDPTNPDDCKEYTKDDYENCVDEELQDVWKPVLDCNPPWLSPQHQCTGYMNATKDLVKNIYKDKRFSIISKMVRMQSYPAVEKCIRPCTVTQSTFFLGEKFPVHWFDESTIEFKFAKQVVYQGKIVGYGFSNFLIDLGSSLGLWFGLSVFGITDLGIMVFQLAKTLKLNASKELLK